MQDEPEAWWRRHGFAAHPEHNECPMGSMRGTVRHFWSFADAAGLVLHAVAADDEWSSGILRLRMTPTMGPPDRCLATGGWAASAMMRGDGDTTQQFARLRPAHLRRGTSDG